MMLDTVRSEGRKLGSLPVMLLTCVATVVATVGLAAIMSWTVSSSIDSDPGAMWEGFSPEAEALQVIHFGQIGMIALGVLAVSNEYAGDQIRTSLLAVPSRGRFLTAKAAAVALMALLVALVTVPLTFLIAQIGLGDHGYPLDSMPDGPVLEALGGAVLYYILIALLAAGVTFLARSAVAPLTVLAIMVLAVSQFLSMFTDLADFLPDRAGGQMSRLEDHTATGLSALQGGAVMVAWLVAVWLVAVVVFRRRDA